MYIDIKVTKKCCQNLGDVLWSNEDRGIPSKPEEGDIERIA